LPRTVLKRTDSDSATQKAVRTTNNGDLRHRNIGESTFTAGSDQLEQGRNPDIPTPQSGLESHDCDAERGTRNAQAP